LLAQSIFKEKMFVLEVLAHGWLLCDFWAWGEAGCWWEWVVEEDTSRQPGSREAGRAWVSISPPKAYPRWPNCPLPAPSAVLKVLPPPNRATGDQTLCTWPLGDISDLNYVICPWPPKTHVHLIVSMHSVPLQSPHS
jgi:hypothetical protein